MGTSHLKKYIISIISFTSLLSLLLFITLMQSIYNYIPETSNVSRVYNVAAVLWLPYMMHVTLAPIKSYYYFYYYHHHRHHPCYHLYARYLQLYT
jgi:hypothetical protein